MSSSPESGCSKCPVLDLGKRYPTGDERDPWRRMPRLFDACRRTFGGGFFNHVGRTRLRTEEQMRQYCQLQRHRYGLCTMRRSGHCQRLLQGVVDRAASADNPHAALGAGLVHLVNAEETHALMKDTVARPANVDALPALDFDFGSQQELLA